MVARLKAREGKRSNNAASYVETSFLRPPRCLLAYTPQLFSPLRLLPFPAMLAGELGSAPGSGVAGDAQGGHGHA